MGSTPVASHRPANPPNAGRMRIRNSGPSHRNGIALVSSPEKVAFPSGLSATGGVSRIAWGRLTSALPGLHTSVPIVLGGFMPPRRSYIGRSDDQLPVWLYLRVVDGDDPVNYLKLRYRVRRGVVIALVLATLNLAGSILRFGIPHPDMQRVTWNSMLGTSFFIGFIEEIPYRGFILQTLAERMNFWVANLITSLLFLWIHVPGWLALHLLRADTMATIFVFVMGIAFRYADSLWTPIIVHSTNDFLSFVVFKV